MKQNCLSKLCFQFRSIRFSIFSPFVLFCEMAFVSRTKLQRKKQSETVLINTSQKSVEVFFEDRIKFLSTNSLIDVFLKIVSDFPTNKSIEVGAFLKVVL